MPADPGHARDQPIPTLAPGDEAARGQLVGVRATGGARRIAGKLHCPTGIVAEGGGLPTAGMERARIVDADGRVRREGLPAHLGRLRRTGRDCGPAGLSCLDPLIGFLKSGPEFVRQIKATVEPRHRIVPRATPDFAQDLPTAPGATRLHGTIRPRAPSLACGLVIEPDGDPVPGGSDHSRGDGRRRAFTDVCDWNGELIALDRAGGEIVTPGARRAPGPSSA